MHHVGITSPGTTTKAQHVEVCLGVTGGRGGVWGDETTGLTLHPHHHASPPHSTAFPAPGGRAVTPGSDFALWDHWWEHRVTPGAATLGTTPDPQAGAAPHRLPHIRGW